MAITEIKQDFKHPKVEYRSVPFWSWNDDLEIDHLKYQLDEMKKGGMAGGFIHSRVGLITPYLSKKWLTLISKSVKYAREIGVPIYLYDEDRWPSGFAGGRVTKNKKYAMRVLEISKVSSNKGSKAGERSFKIQVPSSKYFNNTGYLDTLNREAVKEFINSTYEVYQKAVGEEFNKTIPAIFTDEPNYLAQALSDKDNSCFLPWTKGLEKIFKQDYGYDLKKNLISLIANKGDYKKIRYDFFKLAAELFVNNFGKQLYTWCKENNIALIGHYLWEDSLTLQTKAIGAAMPLYEYMHIPGVDHLGRQIDSAYLTIKQCSSVAHQLGKKRVLSELFGCCGQNMTFTDRKWLGNWNTVLGVNLFCPHLWLYSMAGCRKRDYPPTISYQQPYWKYNKIIEDYFARINFITNQGKFQTDILVIHPIGSAWCLYNPANTKPVDRLNNKFVSLLKTLFGQHYDYDLGDESLIAKYGEVITKVSYRESYRNQAKALFEIGRMKYKLVIIPPVVSLRKTTVELLNLFINKGGRVIGFKPLPERIDGNKDKQGLIKQIYSRITILPGSEKTHANLILSVARFINRSVSIIGTGRNNKNLEIEDIYYQHRVIDNKADIYFLTNNNKDKSYTVRVKIPAGKGKILEIWDPITGDVSVLNEAKIINGYFNCSLYFPEAGARILIKRHLPSKMKYRQLHYQPALPLLSKQVKEIVKFSASKWTCQHKDLNNITLDYCQYKTAGMRTWSKPAYTLDVQSGFEKRLKNNQSFSIRYSFKTKLSKKPEELFLVLERPEQYEIKINNRKVIYKDIGCWVDIAFKKNNIADYVRLKGRNTIELVSRFVQPVKPKTTIYVKGGTEIESVYLLGSFNVQGKFRLRKQGFTGSDFLIVDSKSPDASDTIRSGYPFYTGRFIFSQEFGILAGPLKNKRKRIILSMNKIKAVSLKVTINRKEAGLILWPPYCLDITDLVKKGKNLIEIEIACSLRNPLGPHHHKEINPEFVGPESFNCKELWDDGYTFVEVGLDKNIKIVS